jgi:hypothetical protein
MEYRGLTESPNLTHSHPFGNSYGISSGLIGDNGRMAGQFHWIDAIAMDSKGNLYTGEVDTGKRVQKFVLTNGDGKARPHPHE